MQNFQNKHEGWEDKENSRKDKLESGQKGKMADFERSQGKEHKDDF